MPLDSLNITKCFHKQLHPTPYQFDINTAQLPQKNITQFSTNQIRTTHYTLLSFLPKSLFLQFTRLANCYFLIIAILLSINIISPLNPFTAWAPLLIVIGISMTRQGYQDYQRYKSDKSVNQKSFSVIIRNGEVKQNVKWSQIVVGDVCFVKEDQTFPADMILMKSSNENGLAYIETASLDGERSLKHRSAFTQTQQLTQTQLLHINGHCICPIPNSSLHSFTSTLTIDSKTMQINNEKQLLYRGTKLRNTISIYGVVIYTGENTKIMKNAEIEMRNKMSKVESKVNQVLVVILLIQLVFCFTIAIFYGVYHNQIHNQYYYIDWSPYSSPVDSIITFFTYMVLLNTMIPISLIVSIEIVKLFQKYFIDRDKFMYSEWRETGVKVKMASLNEELGQVEYVFSDKTGTLTKNIMMFSKAIIDNHIFDLKQHPNSHAQQANNPQAFNKQKLQQLLTDQRLDFPLKKSIIIKSPTNKVIQFKTFRQLANQYFLILGLAHQVVTSQDPLHRYHGPSPDQICLVETAREMGYQFLHSSQSKTVISIFNKTTEYQLLSIFSFSSQRKRMSVIVKDPYTQVIKMYIKGADNVIKKRLSQDSKVNIEDELNKLSTQGLRTLLIAMRIIDNHEWENYQQQSKQYLQSNNLQKLQQLQSQLQSNLFLLGATAVQDDLQDDVPQTIRDLLRANIKVWMLTGDKMETAQSVGRACGLIRKDFYVMRFQLSQRSQNTLNQQLQQLVKKANQLKQMSTSKCLLIQGTTIHHITQSPNQTQRVFTYLSTLCESIICCRLLPIQKSSIVQLIRKHQNKITLAIGDGANDITMIKQAHIGIGLYGEQGMGAVQASDYALPQFRMLWRLLFVHGRWNYIRISEMILYFFYKNMLFTIPQFITAFFCAYSGQTVFDDVYVTLYNLIFTALPLIVRAVLEQDINYMIKEKSSQLHLQTNNDIQQRPKPPTLNQFNMQEQQYRLPDKIHVNKFFYRLFPKLYFIGQEECVFNYRNYFAWLIEGMIEATILTVFCFEILGQTAINSTGWSTSFWLVGVIIYTAVMFVVTFKLATHTKFWSSILIWTIILTSLGLYLAYLWISNYALSKYVQGVAYVAWTSAQCYFLILFSVCMILFVDGMVVWVDFRKGSLASRLREIVYREKTNDRQAFDEMSVTITSGLTINRGESSVHQQQQGKNQMHRQ